MVAEAETELKVPVAVSVAVSTRMIVRIPLSPVVTGIIVIGGSRGCRIRVSTCVGMG